MLFYEDLLALPAVDSSPSESLSDSQGLAYLGQIQADQDTVVAVARRLRSLRPSISEPEQDSSLMALLRRKHPDLAQTDGEPDFASLDCDASIQTYMHVLNRAQTISDRIQSMTSSLFSVSSSTSQLRIPLLSLKECQSLIWVCVRNFIVCLTRQMKSTSLRLDPRQRCGGCFEVLGSLKGRNLCSSCRSKATSHFYSVMVSTFPKNS